MTLSIYNDMDIFDNTELVTFVRRDLNGSEVETGNVRALSQQLLDSLLPGTVQSEPQRRLWHLKAASLTVVPARGDRVISTSGTWEIESVETCTLATRYEVRTVKK